MQIQSFYRSNLHHIYKIELITYLIQNCLKSSFSIHQLQQFRSNYKYRA